MPRTDDRMLAIWRASTCGCDPRNDGSSGQRQVGANGGWVWELRRLNRGGLAIAVVLGAWEGAGKSDTPRIRSRLQAVCVVVCMARGAQRWHGRQRPIMRYFHELRRYMSVVALTHPVDTCVSLLPCQVCLGEI